MSIKIIKKETINDKLREYDETARTPDIYERLYSDCTKILIEKWDEYAKRSNLSEKYKNILKYAYTSYLEKLKKLDFINPENITYILEILDKNITSFSNRDNGAYAAWGHDGGLVINQNWLDGKSQEYITKIIYHEMTHSLINRKISGINPVLESTGYTRHHIEKGGQFKNLKLKNERERADSISGFLHELLAEEMAQQLWYENDVRPERTEQPAGLIGFQPDRVIYSNYGPGYNRCYQQLGEVFVENLKNINTPENDTNEKRLKALLKLCLNPNVNVLDTIYNNYRNPDETHKAKLFGALGHVVGRAGKGGKDDVVGQEYILRTKYLMDQGYIYADQELFNVLETDKRRISIRTNPAEITQQAVQLSRTNPGELSSGVEKTKIRIKSRNEREDTTRNKF